MSSPQNQTPNPTPKDQTPPLELKSLWEEMNAGFDRIEKKMHADFQELITPLKDSIKELIEGLKECQELRMMNNDLQHRVNKVEQDNIKLNNKVQQLEDKLLEGNLVFQGIPETLWETHNSTKEKIVLAISHIISGEDLDDRLNQAWNIPIKDVSRLGRYFATCNRPVLVEFYHKTDVEFILSNRRELPKGVYVDKQYSDKQKRKGTS